MAGSYDIGPRVGISGENEFKKQISEINGKIKTLGTEMKVVTAEYAGNEHTIKALRAEMQVLNGQVDAQKQKVETTAKALEAAKQEYGENSKQVQEWTQKLNLAKAELYNLENQQKKTSTELKNAKSITDIVKNATDSLKEKIAETAKKHPDLVNGFKLIGKAAEGVTKAAGEVVKGVAKVGETAVKGLKTAATAAAAAVAAATAAATAAVAAAGKAAFDAATATAAYGDEIDKQSQKIGLSAEAYQEWEYAMSQSGMEISVMEAGMKTLRTQMDKNSDSFKKLGVETRTSTGSLRSQEDVMEETIMKLAGLKNETERARLANELFGKSGSEMAPLLNSGARGIQELRNKAHDLGIVMSNETVANSVKFGDTMDDLKRAIGGVKNNISGQLLPGLTQIAEGFTGLVTGNKEATTQIKDGMKNIISAVREIAPQISSFVKELAPEIVQLIVELIPPLASAIWEVAKELVTTLAKVLKENWPAIKEAGKQVLEALWNGIKIVVPWLWEQIKILVPQIIGKIVGFLKDNWPEIKEAGKNLIKGLWEGIKDMGAWIGEKLKEFGKDIIDKVKGVFGIHSPSRVFRDQIGKNLALGIGEGFDKTMVKVSRDMAGSIPTSFDARIGSTAAGAGGIFDVTVPLSVDGATLAKVVSRYQWSAATGTVRAMGVVR